MYVCLYIRLYKGLYHRMAKKKTPQKQQLLTRASRSDAIYPFNTLLEVGDTFVVADSGKQKSIHSGVRTYNQTHDKKIKVTTRKMVEGLLVTRVK